MNEVRIRQVIILLNSSTFRAIASGRRRGLSALAIRILLHLFAIPYRLIVNVRNYAFDHGWRKIYRVSVPVISVGNLTLGGTGKTPTVAWISKWLMTQKINPVIVSRGYKGNCKDKNDEAVELAEKLPDVRHVQNPDRLKAAQTAVADHAATAIVLDDGFQHRRLGRDFDLVLIDSTEPFGFEYLFPRGTLREPLSNLRRADAVALTRVDCITVECRAILKKRIQSIAPNAVWIEIAHRAAFLTERGGETVSLTSLHNARVVAFCGIGNPENFAQTLAREDWDVRECKEYPDHHHYTQRDSDWLLRRAEQCGATAVLCTHKDLVKIRPLWQGRIPLYAVMLETEMLAGEAELKTLLDVLITDKRLPEGRAI